MSCGQTRSHPPLLLHPPPPCQHSTGYLGGACICPLSPPQVQACGLEVSNHFGTRDQFAGGFPGGSEVKNLSARAGDRDSIPGWGRSPGEGNGNPLQYSCPENPMDRGSWGATVHGVSKSDMTEQLSTHTAVSWKTIFPWTRRRGLFWNDSSALHVLCPLFLLLLHQFRIRH